MKKIVKNFKVIVCSLAAIVLTSPLAAQNVCNPNGNLMIFTNYDGGVLNVNVDQNIPNLIIGVVGYEATQINLSGAFLANVTAVHYAGYNGTNNPCGGVLATSINGAPGGAFTSTVFAPAATISNPNGYGMIICGYSCSNNTNQGGCNTVDQIEAYFLNLFPNSSLYAHRVQYNCWSGTYSVSAGGSCCPVSPFSQGSIAASQTVCSGSTITPLTSSVAASGGTGAISYQWESSTTSPVAGFTSIFGANSSAYSPTPVMVTTYFRRGASTPLNPSLYSNVVTVSVATIGTLSIAGNTAICLPGSSTLTAFAQGAASYNWLSVAGPIFAATPVINVGLVLPGSITLTCTATNAFNCSSTATITLAGLDAPIIAATGATACSGQSATLTANGLLSYQWTGPAGFVSAGQNAIIAIANNTTVGTYSVSGSGLNSCTNIAIVTLTTMPLPTVSVMASNTVICVGQSVTLTATGAQTYSWSVGEPQNPIVVKPTNNPSIYTVTGIDANGCVNMFSTTIQVNACTGIETEAINESMLSLYPNPNAGNFYIEADRAMSLTIFNSIGQLCMRLELTSGNNYSVAVSNLESGIYYALNAQTGERIKIVVVK